MADSLEAQWVSQVREECLFYTEWKSYVTISSDSIETVEKVEISRVATISCHIPMSTLTQNVHDNTFMHLALVEAQRAFDIGEVPVGAIIVSKEQVISAGFNVRERNQDPTDHAEMIVIRKASSELGTWRLNNTTLYVTLEPCSMCAGAIIQARVSRLVFGAFDPKAGACGSICNLLAEPRFNHHVSVTSGVSQNECGAILHTFFQRLRKVGHHEGELNKVV